MSVNNNGKNNRNGTECRSFLYYVITTIIIMTLFTPPGNVLLCCLCRVYVFSPLKDPESRTFDGLFKCELKDNDLHLQCKLEKVKSATGILYLLDMPNLSMVFCAFEMFMHRSQNCTSIILYV